MSTKTAALRKTESTLIDLLPLSTTRVCDTCGEEQDLKAFRPAPHGSGGRLPTCLSCIRARAERDRLEREKRLAEAAERLAEAGGIANGTARTKAGTPKAGVRRKGPPNKATREIRAGAQEYTSKVLEELRRLALGAENEMIRVNAIREILDRGYGEPTQHQVVNANHSFLVPGADLENRWSSEKGDGRQSRRAENFAIRGDRAPARHQMGESCDSDFSRNTRVCACARHGVRR